MPRAICSEPRRTVGGRANATSGATMSRAMPAPRSSPTCSPSSVMPRTALTSAERTRIGAVRFAPTAWIARNWEKRPPRKFSMPPAARTAYCAPVKPSICVNWPETSARNPNRGTASRMEMTMPL